MMSACTMRRVPHSYSDTPSEFVKPDGLNECLECWKLYMSSDDRNLSASRMQLSNDDDDARDADGNLVRDGYQSDPYEEQHVDDMRIGKAVWTIIEEDLKSSHRWAIHKACGIVLVWDFPKLDYMATLMDAHAELEVRLRRNIVTAVKF